MTIGMYQASVPVFQRLLKALDAILDKAVANATERKIDPTVLVAARLAPDMYPLSRQVQIATDHAKGCSARLAGLPVPSFEDSEKTFPELKARIAKTLEFIATVKPEQIDGSEARDIYLEARPARALLQGAGLPGVRRSAELLFPHIDRLQHPAPQRRPDRQARLPGCGLIAHARTAPRQSPKRHKSGAGS